MKFIKKSGLLLLLMVAVALLPLSVQASTLYGVSWNGHNSGSPGTSSLYRIDPETGAGTFIGDLGYAVNAIAVDPTTGRMYGATTCWGGEFNGLLSIDPATGSATEIGSFGTAFNANTVNTIIGLAFNSSGQLFGWYEPRQDNAVTIDLETGTATILGSSRIYWGEQIMAFDNSDRLILVNDTVVYEIDQTNGRAVWNGKLSFDPGSGGGADFDPDTGLLWVSEGGGDVSDSKIRVTDIAGKKYTDIDTDIQFLNALTFGDVESDSDEDGILDSEDFCPETPLGAYIDFEGCSGEQVVDMECPCDGDWKNHGEYMRCVAHSAEDQLADGLITPEEKDAMVSFRAKSDCGKKK